MRLLLGQENDAVMKKADDRKTETMKQVIIDKKSTITCDNSEEITEYIAIARDLNTNVCFNHPQAAWERETKRNANGLNRQYFPIRY